MVGAHRGNSPAIHLTVRPGKKDILTTILRLDQAVAQRSPAQGSGPRCRLLCDKGLIETVAKDTAELLEVRMAERIHLTPTFIENIFTH